MGDDLSYYAHIIRDHAIRTGEDIVCVLFFFGLYVGVFRASCAIGEAVFGPLFMALARAYLYVF